MRGICRGVVQNFFQITVILFCAGAPALAQTAGTLTLVEGRVALIRGATQYTATPGVRLGDEICWRSTPKGRRK
jgi:hypothetical protein